MHFSDWLLVLTIVFAWYHVGIIPGLAVLLETTQRHQRTQNGERGRSERLN